MVRELHLGNRATGITLHSDLRWPAMWRVHRNGRLSDMVNLTRAKDTAIAWAHLSPTDVARWHTREERTGTA